MIDDGGTSQVLLSSRRKDVAAIQSSSAGLYSREVPYGVEQRWRHCRIDGSKILQTPLSWSSSVSLRNRNF
jgi:hypothetical protein